MRRLLIATLIFAGAGLLGLGSADAAPRHGMEKFALIVGIDHFSGRTRSNVGSVGDAIDVREALLRAGWPDGNIRILTDRDATAQAIRDGFRWLAERSRPDTFSVFHYSGHVKQRSGDRDGDGESLDEFLWPTDNRFIADAELGNAMRAVQGLVWVDLSGCEAAGLDDRIASERHLVTAASQEHEKAYEDPNWRNSIFTGLMVDYGILQGQADRNYDGRVTLHEAFGYAAEHAPNMTRNQRKGPQHPYMAGGDGAEWLLNPPAPPPPPPPGGSGCDLCIRRLPV